MTAVRRESLVTVARLVGGGLAALIVVRMLRTRALRCRRALPPYVVSDDRVPLHVEVDGRRDAGPTVVLLHGLGSRLEQWDAQRRVLGRRSRLLLVDQRGHGRSGWRGPAAATPDRLAADLLRVIEEAGRGQVIVIGHSMGARAVLALAARAPALFGDPIAGVGLISPSAGDLDGALLPTARGTRAALWGTWLAAPLLDRSAEFKEAAARMFLTRRLSGRSRIPPWVSRRVERTLSETPLSVVAALGARLVAHNWGASRAALEAVPVLVVTGDADKTIPAAHSRRIADSLGAGCELVVVPGAGHLVPVTHPQPVTAALLRLLQRAQDNASAGVEP